MKVFAMLLAFETLVIGALAQQKRAARPAPTATVSGHVFCADTNAPARMASVVLLPADQLDHLGPAGENHVTSNGEVVQTMLDGSFTIPHVEPGVYYVIATLSGYVSPLTSLYAPSGDPLASAAAKDKKREIAAPRIAVQASLPAAVNITIDRGAAVSGTVLYDDGSPAEGIHVTILVHSKDDWTSLPSSPVASQSYSATSDDQGRYRISGLPPGEYLLQASIDIARTTYRIFGGSGTSMSMNSVYNISFYPGDISRRKNAKPVSVTAGEEVGGQDIDIPLAKLHTVRGSIVAAHDGHVLNGGDVALLYPDDHSRAATAVVSKDDDTFTFPIVPEGDYILQASGVDNDYIEVPDGPGSWPPTHTETKLLRTYGTAEQPIHVAGELSGLVVSAPDPPARTGAN